MRPTTYESADGDVPSFDLFHSLECQGLLGQDYSPEEILETLMIHRSTPDYDLRSQTRIPALFKPPFKGK